MQNEPDVSRPVSREQNGPCEIGGLHDDDGHSGDDGRLALGYIGRLVCHIYSSSDFSETGR